MSEAKNNIKAETEGAVEYISKQANKVYNLSKSYVEKAQLQLKLRDKFCELGKVCYAMHENDSDETGKMKKLISEISKLEADIAIAEEGIKKPKICPICGAKNSADNSFCSKCGEKLD